MKVGEYIYTASYDLNDQANGREYTRYTRAHLLSKFNGALAEIFAYKPETFVEEISLTLIPGTRQTTAVGQFLVSVNANANGTIIREADLDLLRAYAPHDCCAASVVYDSQGNATYTAKSYAIDPKDPRAFYVSPAVPTGMAPAVKVNINAQPPQYTLGDWDVDVPAVAKFQQNIIDFIVGSSQNIDTESPAAKRNATTHLTMFYSALGVKYRVESAYRAGNYNGSVGDGDPRARV